MFGWNGKEDCSKEMGAIVLSAVQKIKKEK
jgi:hypothetical protein